ncbi:hypothetical protein Aph01nite_11660 [Acrocarpospora phusangensis]|uniref:AAA+ ATPase domain-containing protein n=2 Tax=Acrocarpospora phusangensis TaxID=1070424 RepID=A0A919Q653_9ACTN|nr:hypothetical protein Aph01nite_11660 [Acrocarpospora phusangensis]
MGLIALASVVAWRLLPEARAGDIDPLSAVVGLLALAAALWSGRLTLRSLRWQEADIAVLAARLARSIAKAEADARRQLLGADDKAIDLDFIFRAAPARNAEGARPAGRLTEVLEYYRALRPARLVVTGPPGSGKTVLALELLLALLENRADGDPVPVRLSATTWRSGQSVEDMVTSHLRQAYRLRKAEAAELSRAGLILLVIDGLDEMDQDPAPGHDSRAAQALRALNAYQHVRDKASVVLTCRTGQYQVLKQHRIWMQDAAQVEIRPVVSGKALTFLEQRITDVRHWRHVLDALDFYPDGPLAQGLSTPWRLTMAVVIYEQRDPRGHRYLRDPEELTSSALDSPEAVGDHLLHRFIPASIPPDAPYTPSQVHQWLAVLATYLNRNLTGEHHVRGRLLSGNDIELHQLWPLAGATRVRILTALVIAAPWLALAALIGAGIGVAPDYFVIVAIYIVSPLSLLIVWEWKNPWPELARFDLSGFAERSWGFVRGLIFGLVSGIAAGLTLGLLAGLVAFAALGPAPGGPVGGVIGFLSGVAGAALLNGARGKWARAVICLLGIVGGLLGWWIGDLAEGGLMDPWDALTSGLALGAVIGVVMGLVAGPMIGLYWGFVVSTVVEARNLRYAVRANLLSGFVLSFAGGFLFALFFGGMGLWVLSAPEPGEDLSRRDVLASIIPTVLTGSIVVALAAVPLFGPSLGLAGLRYAVLLLCTRKWSGQWLPWRLGGFLDWCYGAGLIRVAGVAYQFRHKEIQEHLARHPQPGGSPSP